jgi:hypothetical protein
MRGATEVGKVGEVDVYTEDEEGEIDKEPVSLR